MKLRPLVNRGFLVDLSFALLVLSLFYAFFIRAVGLSSVVVQTILLLTFVLISILNEARGAAGRMIVIFLLPVAFLAIITMSREAPELEGQLSWTGQAQLWFLLVPLAALAGRVVASSRHARSFARIYALIAIATGTLGLFEWVFRVSVFGRSDLLASDSTGKAIVAADHPLVLGLLLAVGVLAVHESGWRRRRLAIVYLVLCSAGTAAIGPTLAALGLGLVFSSDSFRSLLRQSTSALILAVLATVSVLSLLAVRVWTPAIPGLTLSEYSFQFRMAVHSLIPEMLDYRPMGYGLSGVPAGEWYVYSTLRGDRDLSLTVDSELVLLVAQFGWIGVLLYAFAIILCLIRLDASFAMAITALIVTFSGLFISLHAYGATAILWSATVAMATVSRCPNHRRAYGWGPPRVHDCTGSGGARA